MNIADIQGSQDPYKDPLNLRYNTETAGDI